MAGVSKLERRPPITVEPDSGEREVVTPEDLHAALDAERDNSD